MTALEPWRNLLHSNIVRLKEAFTTRAFRDHCMAFLWLFILFCLYCRQAWYLFYFRYILILIKITALVFVYDYHPNAKTLLEEFLTEHQFEQPQPRSNKRQTYSPHKNEKKLPMNGLFPQKISEQSMWSFVVQLTSALRAIHGAGMAARVVEPSKVLYTGKNRFALMNNLASW